MNRAIVSKRQVAVVLAIAALISSVVTLFLATRTSPFYFEVSMRSSESGTAQLYYDTGRGINADEVITARLREGESRVRFPLAAGTYLGFRLDPIDRGYCQVTLHRVRIIDRSGHAVRRFYPGDFGVFIEVSKKEFVGSEISLDLAAIDNDPGLTIPLHTPLTLRPSRAGWWPFVPKAFLLCFVSLTAVGVTWLLFARRGWVWNGFLLCVLGAFLYLGARSRFFAPLNFDEGVFLWYGSLVNAGAVPYRDIFEPKGPVIFFVNALGLSLFGLKGFLFRIVPTTVALVSITIFYSAMIKRRIAPWLTALLTAQVALWLLSADFHDTGLNDSETYGFAFTLLGFSLGSIGSSLKRRSGQIALQLLSGIFFGLAVLSKELFVFSVIPAWLFLGIPREGIGWNWRQLFLSATGGLLTGISFLSYLVGNSALGSYLELLRFSRTFAANYCVDIGIFPKVSGWSVIPAIWNMLHAYLYNFNHLAFVLVLCALIIPIRRALKHRSGPSVIQLVIATSAVILGMVAVSIGYCFWKHYFFMGMTGLLLISVIGAESLSSYLCDKERRVRQGSFVVLLATFIFVAWSPTQLMLTEARSYHPIATWDPLVRETIERHSKPGDYILVPGIPVIFVALDRRNPYPLGGPSDDILPYLPAASPKLQMEALRQQLEQNLPKVCYFEDLYPPNQKMWHELLYDPLLAKYHYVKVNDHLWHLPDGK